MRNKILIIMVTFGFAILAAFFIGSQNLAEYNGSLEENLSYELPAGYELQEGQGDKDDRYFVRESEGTLETIELYYCGLDSTNDFSGDKTVRIDDATEVFVTLFNWSHDYENELICEIQHEGEGYRLTYQCQETDKDDYYASCSKAQQAEIIGFIRTFDYHRPADEAVGNVFERLYLNYGTGGMILLGLTILFFIGVPVAIGIAGALGSHSSDDESGPGKTSRDLHEAMNRERASRGETSLPSINTVQGVSSNNLARRDHSWSSVPDFFIKMFRRK